VRVEQRRKRTVSSGSDEVVVEGRRHPKAQDLHQSDGTDITVVSGGDQLVIMYAVLFAIWWCPVQHLQQWQQAERCVQSGCMDCHCSVVAVIAIVCLTGEDEDDGDEGAEDAADGDQDDEDDAVSMWNLSR